MTCRSDLTLSEALSDPIIGSLMKADGVDRNELKQTLTALARQLGVGKGGTPQLRACCE